MASPLYSVLIYEGHSLPSDSTKVPVLVDPAYLWVVRDMTIFLPGPDLAAWGAVIAAVVDATIWQVSVLVNETSVRGSSFHWFGRQVFDPPEDGHILDVQGTSDLGGIDVRISGYRLTKP